MLAHSALADLASRSYSGRQSGVVAVDVRYDLVPRAGELVIVLPGTDPRDAIDWIRDLSAWPMWARGLGPVHAGFGSGALAAMPAISRATYHDVRSLYTYAGHSLGGAMAQALAAMHTLRLPGDTVRVVTFGAPRVGFCNPHLPWLLRTRCVEAVAYERRGDVVPHLPARWLGYHAGIFWPTAIGTSVGNAIEDHSITRYRDDLAAVGL